MQVSAATDATTKNAATRDLYREVTDKIISLIESGVAPWRRTWSCYGLARNYATGHIYTGINFILMNHTEHPIPNFLTFSQIQERNGKIRKGAKAEQVIYFSVYYKDSQDQTISKEQAQARSEAGEAIQILKFIKYYNVFNVADIEGIDFKYSEVVLKPHEKISRCEGIVEQMPKRPEFKCIDSNRAFYSPRLDFVNMPAIEQFETPEEYYSALFHELTHATGHASRLAREEITNPQSFGTNAYSREELVAEMGASFLCAQAQIDYDGMMENNAAYLGEWLKVLQADSKFIFKAAAEAQKAADFILNRRQPAGE